MNSKILASSARCEHIGRLSRFLNYSEADFGVFRPAGAICCTDGGEIWYGPLLRAKFHPIGATIRV